MSAVTFVCDLCGAPGRAERPGSAQCENCGWVAIVYAPSTDGIELAPPGEAAAPPEAGRAPDPFAVGSGTPAPRPAREATPPVATPLARLWTPPGRTGGETPEPSSIQAIRAPRDRARRARRALVPAGVLAAGAALAVGAAAIAIRSGWVGSDDASTREAPAATWAAPQTDPLAPTGPAPASPPRADRSAPSRVPAQAQRPQRVAASARSPATGAPELVPARATSSRNPAPEDRTCVPRALRARADLADRLPAEITARFPVGANGAIGRIDVGDVPDREVARAIEAAIRGCPFVAGADEEGRPTALSVVMRIKFGVR
jgi:hypothetical protein